MSYAFIGAQDPLDFDQIERDFGTASYNLERTIMTHLERSDGQ